MAARKPISLDISLRDDSVHDWGANTYRKDGISISTQRTRLFGKEVPMEVSYDDLVVGQRIGRGACSSVYVATHTETRAKYAVKTFNTFDDSQTSQLRSEIMALIEVDCEAIARIQGAWHKDNTIGLIIEYMDLGSLDFLLSDKYRGLQVPEKVLAAIAYQILWGMCYLHYSKTMHRDIKPANILLSSDGEVKLSDFGISSVLNASTTLADTSVGTFRFMSPERLLGERYGPTSDVWSLGLTLIQLVLRRYPFEHCAASSIDLIEELEATDFATFLSSFRRTAPSNRSGRTEEGVCRFSPLLIAFLSSMLTIDPSMRATSEALLHDSEWLQEMLQEEVGAGLESVRQVVKGWIDDNRMAEGEEVDLSQSVGWKERERAELRGLVEDRVAQSKKSSYDFEDELFEKQFEQELGHHGGRRGKVGSSFKDVDVDEKDKFALSTSFGSDRGERDGGSRGCK